MFSCQKEMTVFEIILLIVCAVLIPILAILYIDYSKKREQFLLSDPKLNDVLDKFREFFDKNKNTEWKKPLEKLNEMDIMNDIKYYRGEKSYTINKEKVYICMKDNDGNYYDENMLVYVIAHEMAHCICDEIGHTKKFHEIFKELLTKLINQGYYNPSIPVIKNYCEDGDPEI